MKTTAVTARIARSEEGFSLVELLVTMGIAMVILAGLYYNFFLQARVQETQTSSVDALQDLRLASSIMTGPLRLAANICVDPTNKNLVYQPLQSTVTMTAVNGICASAPDASWGVFHFVQLTPTEGAITWYNPVTSGAGYQQLIKGLDPNTGLLATPVGSVWQVILHGQYQNIGRTSQPLYIKFDVMPRN